MISPGLQMNLQRMRTAGYFGMGPAPGTPMNAPAPGYGPGYGQPQTQMPYPNAGGNKLMQIANGLAGRGNQNNPQLPFFPEDRDRLGGLLNGQNPFAGQEWGGLIKQLQDQAAGKGPSLAEQSYSRAQGDTTAAMTSMAQASASPAAARQAIIQRQRVGQGMASGLAEARTGEMMGAQSALAQVLASRDTLNQNAYLDVLGKQLGLSKDQLQALLTNNQTKAQRDAAAAQAKAAKYNAIAGGIGTAASLL